MEEEENVQCTGEPTDSLVKVRACSQSASAPRPHRVARRLIYCIRDCTVVQKGEEDHHYTVTMTEATLVGSTMGGGTLSWLDYGVFSLMLLLSLLVGVYFAIKSRNKGNDEFLVGGRSMTCLPMSMSLVVTYLSAVSLQGFPAETFYHSMQPVLTKSSILAIPIAAAVFVPFYYELKIVSAYQYLEMRFNSVTTRRVASALFITQTLLYQAIVIYAPALALAAVTDFPMWLAILVGGLKAVVWTDALQFVIVLGGLMTIVIMGVKEVGSLQKVWDINVKHKRAGLQIFNWSPDIFERHTVWGLSWFGFFSSIVKYGSSQTAIQRYSSMKSLTHAYLSVLLLVPYFAADAVLLTLTVNMLKDPRPTSYSSICSSMTHDTLVALVYAPV
ncbi:Sodium-dependent multivitamin transporter-like 1 [Homarus americanus]|uniref:Sodium-dependent multivitamin transporter-like 1 n=1 Tax=Homarus americanus TaxID=6706 RepID=A0A8J5J6I1_HOMAM|nr:Sodium-dependent multivitamin transporter-like 1 [Homarus americanus]